MMHDFSARIYHARDLKGECENACVGIMTNGKKELSNMQLKTIEYVKGGEKKMKQKKREKKEGERKRKIK